MSIEYNLAIPKGGEFNQSFPAINDYGAAFSLAGYSVSGFVRYKHSSANYILNLAPVVVDNTGVILNIPSTGSINFPVGVIHYDIDASNGTDLAKILFGRIDVFQDSSSITGDNVVINYTPTTNTNFLTGASITGGLGITGLVSFVGSVTQNGNEIQIGGASMGEANLGSNLGNGSGLYASKVGVTLQFKSLKGGEGVSLTGDSSNLSINIDTSSLATQISVASTGSAACSGMWETVYGTSPVSKGDCLLNFYVDCGGSGYTQGWVNVDGWQNISPKNNTKEMQFWPHLAGDNSEGGGVGEISTVYMS